MSWLMNNLFRMSSYSSTQYWHWTVGKHLSVSGAQQLMAQQLDATEKQRATLFKRELAERETTDVLDRALLKAYHGKLAGAIDAPSYHKIHDKVMSLKKLRFSLDYDKTRDPEALEWMKYKVAAEVGGTEEREAFKLFEKSLI